MIGKDSRWDYSTDNEHTIEQDEYKNREEYRNTIGYTLRNN